MTQLIKYGQKVETFFDLLGNDENAMTFSLGWALSESDTLCQKLAAMLCLGDNFSDAMHLRLQEYEFQKGISDIEIVDPGRFHIVIEAKRGFNIPLSDQLEKYAERLSSNRDPKARKMILVLAESDREEQWLPRHVPANVCQVEVQAISWKQIRDMAEECVGLATKLSEKLLLRQLIDYFRKVTTMQNKMSNLVYVVSASNKVIFKDVGTTFIDVIEKHQRYFHPVGKSYPVDPPNYIAFRYHSKLQSIHHIDSYTIIEDYQIPFDLPNPFPIDKHYLYELGPAIKPAKEIRTNDKAKGFTQITMSARRWCFIDLLLTCDSISEALVKTRQRLKGD